MSAGKDIWPTLAAEAQPETGYARRRVDVASGMDVYFALAQPGSRQSIIVEVSATSVDGAPHIHSCSGFTFDAVPIHPGPHGRIMMLLELADRRYEDVFSALADDVVGCLGAAKAEKEGVRLLLDRLRRWHDFFRQHKADGLSEHEQQGLYGELWFLRNVLLPCTGPDRAVTAWRGPDGTNQDFHLPSCAVEIKTSSSNPHEKVTISNVLQLDESGLPALFMAHLALDPRRGSGETLRGIAEDIRTFLAENAIHLSGAFDLLLVKAGYLDAHAKRYDDTGFNLRHVRYYRVQGEFPRLRERDLPAGVGDVRYSIVVSACCGFEVPPDRLAKLLQEVPR